MRSFPEKSIYSIQQVSDITGISKQVIRKWEERYQLVRPNRMENGYRSYTEKDINILLKVKTLTETGNSIKQAATIIAMEDSFLKEDFTGNEVKLGQQFEEKNEFVLQLIKEGVYCNEQGMTIILQQAYHSLGLENFLKVVVVPFLNEVGTHWQTKQWSEYQEALSSLVVRDFLIQIRRNFKYVEGAPLLMGACLPSEQHEVPLHILLLQGMIRGWKTLLIGSSPAPGSIEEMVEKCKPKKVLLSATTTIPFKDNLIQKLDDFAGKHNTVEFFLGGNGTIEYFKGNSFSLKNIHITNSIDDVI